MRALREHAEAHDLEVVDEIIDVGEKRHDAARPGLDRLRDLAESGAISEVWAWEWSRYGSFPVPEVLAVELRDYGVELRSLDDNGGGEDGEDMQVIKSLFSRREQRDRARRAKRGRGDKAKRGEIFGGFQARYGFKFTKGTNQAGREVNTGYEPDPEHMGHVRHIFEMVADGVGLKGVKREFEQAGIPNPTGGPRWSTTTIRGVVNDDVYRPHAFEEIAAMVAPEVAAGLDPEGVYGVSWSGRKRSKFASSRGKKRIVYETPREEWTAVPVSLDGSGLDRAVVDRARAQIKDNRSPTKIGDRFWELSSILFCGSCGRRMIAYPRKKKNGRYLHYYRCRPGSIVVDVCPNRKSHPAENLEQEAARTFQENVSYGTLLDMFDKAVEEEADATGLRDSLERRASLTAKMSELELERKGYLRQNARGVLSDGELDGMLADVDAQRDAFAAELNSVEDAATKAQRIADARRSLRSMMDKWGEDPYAMMPWEFPTAAATPEQRRSAYNRYGARFEVDPDGRLTLRLDLDLPDPPSRLDLDLAGHGVANENNMTTLCAPAAATSRARLAYRCPATSAKSSVAKPSLPFWGAGSAGAMRRPSPRKSTASFRVLIPNTSTPPITAASGASLCGRTSRRRPSFLAPSAMERAPLMPLTPPSSESSPTTPALSSPPGASAPEAARMPSAIGKSNAGPSFLRLAGARFTITRFIGNL
jgi:site-specific DNA recombinase